MSLDVFERQRRLERTFRAAFRVADLAEGLVSFEAGQDCRDVSAAIAARGFTVAGLVEGETVTGYLQASDLARAAGPCVAFRRAFEASRCLDADAPLDAGLRKLRDADLLFVSALGRVYGILTWTDVQKPPVRMWLFGLITLLESAFTSLIEAWHPDASWTELVSDGRLRKARAIAEERQRLRGDSDQRLLDCLQLSDKGMILLRRPETRRLLGVASKEAGERALHRLAGLRDSLAHSQDIVTGDWDMILRLAERLDDILGLASAFQPARRARPRQDGRAR